MFVQTESLFYRLYVSDVRGTGWFHIYLCIYHSDKRVILTGLDVRFVLNVRLQIIITIIIMQKNPRRAVNTAERLVLAHLI